MQSLCSIFIDRVIEYEIIYVDRWRVHLQIELRTVAYKLKITTHFDWVKFRSYNK
jgi:hypothetical protein